MGGIWQAAALAVLAAFAALLVRRSGGEFALLISIAAGTALVTLCVGYLASIFSTLDELRQTAGLNRAVTAPLLKAVGIALVSKLAAGICTQAGEGALAAFVELCGTVLSVFVCIPLLQAVMELLALLISGVY